MNKILPAVRDIGILLVVVWLAVVVTRWITGPGVSPEQAHTIDSLRTVNRTLDSVATEALIEAAATSARVDSAQRAARVKAKRDSTKLVRTTDSLEALIPDTATVVPREVHDRIVANKDSLIVLFHGLWHSTDSVLVATRSREDSLARLLGQFQTQNRALLAQVNDLERKANPGLLRRLKYAAPFLGGLYAGCKTGVIECEH